MSLSINTNNSALVALEALNATQAQLSSAENTVSTGQKISNAADNPAIYAIAASMNGNLQGLSAVSDSLSLGAQVVSTANTASNFITSTLQTLQNTVTAAGQTGIDASAMAAQVLSAIDTINGYARNATFSGVNLLTSGSDAVNAYNGTTLQTLSNLQGSTIQFASAAGSDTTLADKLGLSTGSAAGSAASASTQSIFSALNASNVTHIDTSNLTTSNITLGNGTSAGTTLTVGNKTFEFVQSGDQVSTAGNVAVALDTGFSTTSALSALTAALNGSGISATLNSDNSLSVQGAAYTTDVSKMTDGTIVAGNSSTTNTTVTAGTGASAVTYEFTTDASKVAAGNTAVVVAAGATTADEMAALNQASKGAISYDAQSGVIQSAQKLAFNNTITTGSEYYLGGTGGLTASDIVPMDASNPAAPTTVTFAASTHVYEFTTTGQVKNAGDIAVKLDVGFTAADAMKALAATATANGDTTSYVAGTNTLAVAGAATTVQFKNFSASSTTTIPTAAAMSISNDQISSADVSNLKTTDFTAAGDNTDTTLKLGTSTYEFTTTGGVGTTGNIAVKLNSNFTVADALNALVSTATANGDYASYNATAGTLSGIDLTGTNLTTPADYGTPAALSAVSTVPTSTANIQAQSGGYTPTALTQFATSAGKAADQLAVGFKSGVTTAVSALQSAINNMSSVSQTLGNYSNQITGLQSYTSNVSDALTSGVGALTNADMAAASAKLTSLQTKQQLAIKSLTIANSQSQNILSLFQ